METDDHQKGQILSRRDALKLLGITGAALLTGCAPAVSEVLETGTATALPIADATSAGSALPACVVRPELTEGPYYVDEALNRSDVRADPASGAVKAGAPLALTFNISQVSSVGCKPLSGARVDIWHCDAEGVYSDVSDPRFDTKGEKFLRGYQVTGADGRAAFTTIYPGWYPGRTVHIHFKVYQEAPGGGREFTSQLFFDDALSDRVFTQAPYTGRGQQDTLNGDDGIYNDQLLLDVVPADAGYRAVFEIGLQLD